MRTALWLLMAQLLLFVAGAVLMPTRPEYEAMNSTALFKWLIESPLSVTWWLWASVLVLSLMTLNTVACSIESVIRKRQNRQWLLVVSPQIIHVGFILMLVAHLLSSAGATRGGAVVREGTLISLDNESTLRVKSLSVTISPRGYPMDWRADIDFFDGGQVLTPSRSDHLAPNKPSFHRGFGVYLKDIRPYPVKTALLEINREPGAPWALAGGILFTIGTIALVALKIRRER
jgi:cytochrome c biogenesis protein ResB